MGKIYINYEDSTEAINNIRGKINEIQSTLESISALYSEINSGDVYSGFSASQYENTFNTLKRTAFVKVPELTDRVNKLMAEARNQYVESENSQYVLMKNGHVSYYSRGRRKRFLDNYLKYIT